jgi:hypothetical protein
MALSATQVTRNYDYYNSTTLLPGYILSGREDEQSIAKAYYSTDFSSDPIGSKADFFNHLKDPCLDINDPSPVFNIPKSLSALDPQWFNGWWDNAMYYSHPLVTASISASNPDVFQEFSDSVGYLSYTPTESDPNSPTYGNDAISSAIAHKVPNKLLGLINGLNSNALANFKINAPGSVNSKSKTFLSQVQALQKVSSSLQQTLTDQVGGLKNKLPFATNISGNLITPTGWSHSYNVEGIKTAVNSINNVITAPSRMISNALNKVQNLLPKITLPSISKLLGGLVPSMPAVSNVLGKVKQASTFAKSALGQAQGALAAGNAAVASVAGSINTVTGAVMPITTAIKNTAVDINNINSIVNVGNGAGVAGLINQSPGSISSPNNKLFVASGGINSNGNKSVLTVETFGKT